MTSSNDTLIIETHDGGHMPAFVAAPPVGSGPALILLQEIFGVTDYIRSRARDLAKLGYFVVAPELYWRLGSHVTTDETTEAGLNEAFGIFRKLDVPRAVDDAIAALEQARAMPQSGGRAGVLGFCLGGRLAFEVGVHATPDVIVSYYGSGIADRLTDAPQIRSPIMFHFGAADTFLPPDQAQRIREVFEQDPNAQFHTHADAGHAFDNFRAPIFYHQTAADEAWSQTTAFLEQHFPPTPQS